MGPLRPDGRGAVARSGREAAVVALCLTLALSAAALLREKQRAPGIDFYHFWLMGRAIPTHGQAGVYTAASLAAISAEGRAQAEAQPAEPRRLAAARHRSEHFEPNATPFLYSLFGQLATGSYERDLARYQALCLGALLAGGLILCRLLGYGLVPALAIAVVVVGWYAPVVSDLQVGNVGALQLAALALFLANQARQPSRRRDLAGGAILGLAIAFKPTFAAAAAAMALAWALERRLATLRDAALGGAAAGAAALAATVLDHGTLRCWSGWLGFLSFERHWLADGNFALAQLALERLGLAVALPLGAASGLAAAVALAWACGGRPAPGGRGEARRDLLAASLGCQAYLVGGPLVWLHYYLLALPAILVALAPGARAQATACGALTLAVLCLPRLVDVGDGAAYTAVLATAMALLGATSARALRANAPSEANAAAPAGARARARSRDRRSRGASRGRGSSPA